MKPLLGALFLWQCGLCTAADWEYVTATGTSNVYLDMESLSTPASGVKVGWFIFDHLDTRYDLEAARVFKSSRQRIEAHCANDRLQWTRMETFSGPLGTGTKLAARDIDNQRAATMENVNESARAAMLKILCE